MQTDLRLFGIDLPRAWGQARQAGLDLLRGPWLQWLSPRPQLQRIPAGEGPAPAATASYQAVELPEQWLLRRQLSLPLRSAPAAQIRAAVALDVQLHSPFAPAHTLWAEHAAPQGAGLQVDYVIASRPLAEAHLRSRGLDPAVVEVWVRMGQTHAVLPGFGEWRRQRAIRRGRAFALFLVLACLAWLGAIAISPTLQLRAHALQAVASFDALVAQATPAIQQRDAYLLAQARAEQVRQSQQQATPVLPMLATLTQALPDDTFLSSLQLQGRTVRMSGQSHNAAELMKRLGEIPGVADVRAPSPATRPPGANREVFTIELTLLPSSEPARP